MSDDFRCTIGPVGLDVPLPDPEISKWAADGIRLTSSTASDDAERSKVLVDQLLGLADLAGQAQPCTFSGLGERFDGHYIIGAPTLDSDGASISDGDFTWQVNLGRVRSSAQVQQALRMSGAARVNEFFTTERRGWWSPGVDAWGIDDGTGTVNAPLRAVRTGADGPMLVSVANPDGDTLLDTTGTWYVGAKDFYRGSAWPGQIIGGDLYRVVGRYMPPTTKWALSNSLMSLRGGVTDNVVEIVAVWHDGDRWSAPKSLVITEGSGWTEQAGRPVGVQVIRSSPDLSAVRVFFAERNAAGRSWLDVALRRGARHAECKWNAGQGNWGVALVEPEACDLHTSGVHAEAADPSGHKVVLTTPVAVTRDDTNGRIRTTATTTSFRFMIGAEPPDALEGLDHFDDIVYQYMGTCSVPAQRAVLA